MVIDKNILSIDSDDDNYEYEAFSEFLSEDTRRKKIKTASDIEKMGYSLLIEIEKKQIKENIKKKKYIEYILKHNDEYDKETLLSYSIKDVGEIYNEIKELNKPMFIKFFHFLFNIE